MDESILMNYLRGGCNDEECQQVELWCEEAPENRQILEQLYYTLFVGDRMAVMDAVDTEASLTKFKSLVREKEKKAKRRSISVRWGRYASATAAFLAASGSTDATGSCSAFIVELSDVLPTSSALRALALASAAATAALRASSPFAIAGSVFPFAAAFSA